MMQLQQISPGPIALSDGHTQQIQHSQNLIAAAFQNVLGKTNDAYADKHKLIMDQANSYNAMVAKIRDLTIKMLAEEPDLEKVEKWNSIAQSIVKSNPDSFDGRLIYQAAARCGARHSSQRSKEIII